MDSYHKTEKDFNDLEIPQEQSSPAAGSRWYVAAFKIQENSHWLRGLLIKIAASQIAGKLCLGDFT